MQEVTRSGLSAGPSTASQAHTLGGGNWGGGVCCSFRGRPRGGCRCPATSCRVHSGEFDWGGSCDVLWGCWGFAGWASHVGCTRGGGCDIYWGCGVGWAGKGGGGSVGVRCMRCTCMQQTTLLSGQQITLVSGQKRHRLNPSTHIGPILQHFDLFEHTAASKHTAELSLHIVYGDEDIAL